MKPPAGPELLDLYAAVLVDLGSRYGISNLRHGGPGAVVADVEQGKTYLDVAHFEREAEALLGHDVFVISSDAPAAKDLKGAPLKSATAA